MIKNRWKGEIVPKLILLLIIFSIIAGNMVQAANPPSGYSSVLDGTITRDTTLAQSTGVTFKMDFSACTSFPSYTSSGGGITKDGRFLVYTLPNSNITSIPETLTIVYSNAAVDYAGTRYDLKMIINNIVIGNYKRSNAKGHKIRLFAIADSDKTPWVEAYTTGVTLQNAMKYITYDVTMQIVNKQGTAQNGTFVFAVKDVDIPAGNSLGYGDYSEGLTLLSGFTISTLKVKTDSTLCYKRNGSTIRLTGTERNSESDRDPTGAEAEKSGFSVIGNASGVKFNYSAGINCGTGLCDAGQPVALQPLQQANPVSVSGKSLTYNGSAQDLVSVSNNKGTMSYSVNGGAWSSTAKGTNAGTYTIAWKDAGNASYLPKSGTVTTTIGKKSVAVSWGTLTFVYDGNEKKPTASASGPGTLTVTNNKTAKVVGSYTATASTTNGNYTLTNAQKTFTITKKPYTKPTVASNPTYSGVSQTASLNNFNSSVMNVSNNTRIDAGSQNVSVSLKDTANTMWADGSTGALSLSWTINKKSYAVTWGSTTSFVYNGSAQGPSVTTPISGMNGEKLNITKTTATNVGSYTSTATLSSVTGGRAKTANYTITNTTKNFTITKLKLNKPTAVNKTYTYNKSEQTFEVNGFNSSTMTISNNKRTNAGSQTVTIALKDKTNYGWQTDGSTADVTFTFKINKASCTLTPATTNVTKINEKNIQVTNVNRGEDNVPISYTYTGDGTVTAASSNTNLATVSINTTSRNVTITRKSTLNSGTLTVTISAAEGNNYLATSATINVTVVDVIPKITKVHINNDASTTKNFDVVVSLDTKSQNQLSYVYISENNATPSISFGGWIPYSKHSIFRLSLRNGSKNIYVWVKDAYDNVSPSTITANVHNHTASINLDARYTAKVICHQTTTSPNDYRIMYAIKQAGGAYSEWQTSDEFKGLLAYNTYVIKTKIEHTATGVSRESKEHTFSASYDSAGNLRLEE